MRTRASFWVFALAVLAFIYVPLGVVAINSFNSDRTFGWPPPGLTTRWWSVALKAPGPRDALRTSVEAGLGATAIALVLASLLALALTRYRFFGRNAISLLVILPIALPGIVTGIALQSVIPNLLNPIFGINAGLFTIIVGHATFCIVVSSTTSRPGCGAWAGRWSPRRPTSAPGLRNVPPGDLPTASLSRPCGRPAGLRPQLRRDRGHDVHSETGQPTLPIWIFNNLFRPNQAPVVNVVAVVLVAVSILPVFLAQRLSGTEAAESRL